MLHRYFMPSARAAKLKAAWILSVQVASTFVCHPAGLGVPRIRHGSLLNVNYVRTNTFATGMPGIVAGCRFLYRTERALGSLTPSLPAANLKP